MEKDMMTQDVQSQSSGQTVSVSDVHAHVLTAVKEAFPELVTVEDYTELPDSGDFPCPVPAFLLTMPSFAHSADTGAERLLVTLDFEARVFGGSTGEGKERAIRDLVAKLALFIDGNRFGLSMQGARFVKACVDTAFPKFASLSPWLLTFQVSICIRSEGEEFATPDTVFLSMAPEIGLKHLDKYTKVYPVEE